MNDMAGSEGDAVQLFGDPRSRYIERGPERRISANESPAPGQAILPLGVDAGQANAPRSDLLSTVLAVLSLFVFGTAIIAGALILYNAKSVGAFRDPWDSTRVAIGIAVLAIGIIQAAILVGLSRALSYLSAERRRHA